MAETNKNISRINNFSNHAQDGTGFGVVVYPVGGTYGPRVQQYLQLVLIQEGSVEITLNEKVCPLAALQVALLFPGLKEYFKFSNLVQTRHSWIHINPNILSGDVKQVLKGIPFSLPCSQRLESLVEIGLSIPRTEETTYDELIHKIAEASLWEYIVTARVHLDKTTVMPESLHRATQFIKSYYSEEINLKRISEVACVTTVHLTRLFNAHYHTTPIKFLWRYRIQHGIGLLRNTGLTIAEIAFQCGFQSPFHFSRMVKENQKISPKELRKQWWEGKNRLQPSQGNTRKVKEDI